MPHTCQPVTTKFTVRFTTRRTTGLKKVAAVCIVTAATVRIATAAAVVFIAGSITAPWFATPVPSTEWAAAATS